MREDIGLFRGKRLDNGEWVEGDLLHPDKELNFDFAIELWDKSAKANCYAVDPATIGEYTGLKDNNGKRIFEGDIIGAIDFFDGEITSGGVVRYGTFNCGCCNGVYGWYIDGGDIRDANSSMFEPSVLVIGNIHDNPELLEG